MSTAPAGGLRPLPGTAAGSVLAEVVPVSAAAPSEGGGSTASEETIAGEPLPVSVALGELLAGAPMASFEGLPPPATSNAWSAVTVSVEVVVGVETGPAVITNVA
jgi:hypothetical protein